MYKILLCPTQIVLKSNRHLFSVIPFQVKKATIFGSDAGNAGNTVKHKVFQAIQMQASPKQKGSDCVHVPQTIENQWGGGFVPKFRAERHVQKRVIKPHFSLNLAMSPAFWGRTI